MYKDIHTFSLKPKVSLGRGVFYMGRGFNKFGPTRLGRGVNRPGPRCRWAEASVYQIKAMNRTLEICYSQWIKTYMYIIQVYNNK